MKKLFLIIVVSLLGIGSVFADVTHTINVYARAEGSGNQNAGGTIKVQPATLTQEYFFINISWNEGLWSTCGYSVTCEPTEATGTIFSNAYIKLAVCKADENYYFTDWYEDENCTKSISYDDKDGYGLPYADKDCEWWGNCKWYSYVKNFYAYFMKYRWGYVYPCQVQAIGGGVVSVSEDGSNASVQLTPSGLINREKDIAIEYTYYAHETASVEFVGWYDNANGDGDPISTELSLTKSYIPTSTDKSNPSIVGGTYYAIFRPKLMGYAEPCMIKISGTGAVSFTGEDGSYSSTEISQTPPISYVYNKNVDEKITVSYYAKTTDNTYVFIGWFNENDECVSEDLTYTYSYRPTSVNAADLVCPPTLTAKFVPNNYYYVDLATAIALLEEDGETYLGKVFVDDGTKTGIDDVADSDWTIESSFGSKETKNSYQFTYTYYAKPDDDQYAFREWVTMKVITDDEGNPTGVEESVVSDEPVFTYTVDYTNQEWQSGEENAFTPPTLYARFQTSRCYYHGRATVGVATNSEEGGVFVGATETAEPAYYTPTDDQPFYASQETVVDNDGDGSTNQDIIETELNQNKYKYYYYAQPSEPATFKGWTVLPTGDNIISNANPYILESTASETPTSDGPMPMYAVFHSYYHTLPRVVSVGSGLVKINDQTDFVEEINNTTAIPSRPDTDNEGNDKSYYSYTYTLTAQANDGASFLGWSTSDSEEDIVSREGTYVVRGTTSSTVAETPHRITVYAIFESDIKIKHTDRMIYYEEDGAEYINDVNIILEVAKAATVKATLTGNTADFNLINSTLTEQGDVITLDASTSIIPLRLMYVGNDAPLVGAVGKQANITFTSYDSDGNQLAANGKVVTIERKPVVTFLPADGRGSYTVSHTDGSGVTYTLGENSDQSVAIDVTHESKSYLEINLTDKTDDGMEFFAWQVIENYGTATEKISYLSYDKIYTHHFTKSVTIRPEFIPEGWARYIIKSNPEVQYFDLKKAIEQACVGVNVDEKMIVVYRNGLLPKGEYTIPRGVTLLVPGEGPGDGFGSADYLSQTNGSLSANDYLVESFSPAKYKCYRKLTIEDGTRLTVSDGANICVSARMIIQGQSLLAFPYHYGHIELGNDAVINLTDGATLYAWGYITNPNDQRVTMHNYKEVGRVEAQSGANVWEPLSFTDFRGGSATINFVKLSGWGGLVGGLVGDTDGYRHGVFPINQYYVQAIEAPLILKSGATENLSTAIHANDVTSATPSVLIGADNGLFRWGSATATMIKYYDATTDRTKYIVEDTQNSATSVKLGNIGLKLSVLNQTVDVNSSDYVMPVTNGMDIYIKNARVEFPSGINIALMAGASMHIDKNSTVVNNAQIYVYDKDQNVIKEGLTTGYFGSGDAQILPIKGRPYPIINLISKTYKDLDELKTAHPTANEGDAYNVGTDYYVWSNSQWLKNALKVTRGVESITDASLVVDGVLNCSGGYLITTSSGANITSNGGGEIQISNFGAASGTSWGNIVRNQSVFQYNQAADGDLEVGYVAMPLATNNSTYYPRLYNAEGAYTEATTAGTYYYCDGVWTKADSDPCTDEVATEVLDYTPRFSLTAPTMECYIGEGEKTFEMQFELLNGNLKQEDWAEVVWSAEFTGNAANLFKFNTTATPSITFNPASVGSKKAVMIVTATYTKDEVEYVHSQAIDLLAVAKEQTANTLAFNDFSQLWVGQTDVQLYTTTGSNSKEIKIEIEGESGVISAVENGKFTALAEGSVKVTISQDQDNEHHVAGTTLTTTIKVNPRVVWNWSELYYPSVNTNPITMMDGSTGWTLEYEIVPESGDVVKFTGSGSTEENPNSTYQAEIFDLIQGKYEAKFIFKQNGYDDIEFTSEIYRDVRRVRLDVNNDTVYNAITVVEPEGVSFDKVAKTVYIQSEALQTNAWTIHFIGVPDKIYFVPTGDKAWQIEESTNGTTWTTTRTWATIEEDEKFEFSLMPSTQYVRISYAAGGEATLRDIYITKLEGVKFDPAKLYMPANIGATKNVAITYVSDNGITIAPSIAGEFSANPASLSQTTEQQLYNVANVVITNEGCTEQKLTGVNVVSSIATEILPIQTYTYPQGLPIVLASDMPTERFHFVTTYTYNTTWNAENRTITMHNAVANAQPFMTFHFFGAPTYISFNHDADDSGEWIIEESVNGIDWSTPSANSNNVDADGVVKRYVAQGSTYIRVTYNSLHTSNVNITNLMIIGEEGASVDKTEMMVKYVNETTNSETLEVTAINLANGMVIESDNTAFTLKHGEATANQSFTLTNADYSDIFAANTMGSLPFTVYFDGSKAVDYATITIKNIPGEGETEKVLATVKVTGVRNTLTDGDYDFKTGVPTEYTLNGSFEGKDHADVDITYAFDSNGAQFDYLFIFGETTTEDGTTAITTPTTTAGSNAKTPCYIYKKKDNAYEFYSIIENANSGTKVTQDFLILPGTQTDAESGDKSETEETLKVYISGFCPYASTGYTKDDEGVFFFQGGAGDNVHVYLENCYLYSRAKTENGHYFENRSDGYSFTDYYVRGSGGVLVFECSNDQNQGKPFNVSIHTRGRNMLKSHYGCFLESVAGRAFQVSSPVQIHMKNETFIEASYTTLSFDDIWNGERTNGFLSLQKQVNNAPSIDMGNAKTVVNFNGGRVELQNAQNVSDNYTSTLAISHRDGTFAGFRLAYGLGSDGVGGTVNFNDGTTTVRTMTVDERYRQYYLMDKDAEGNELTTTSCLRCPQNTYVYGGSHCMMRACSEPTSKGGAPKNGPDGAALGLYKYPAAAVMDGETVTKKGGWSSNGTMGLVTPTDPPTDYNVKSVCPNTNGTDDASDDFLNFWVTSDYDQSVVPEVDQKVSFWKACMTRISAKFAGYGGEVGGDIKIATDAEGNQTELVSNLLYCTIDQKIREVITGDYSAPVKSPLPSGDPYLTIKPNDIGDSTQHYVLNNKTYQIEDKIYYITTATADLWMTFTAPFDVEKIYVVETCNESDLETFAEQFTPPTDEEIESSEEEIATNAREATMELQARHNADFAAFFGVAMAIHPNKTFDQIYSDYEAWAKTQSIEPGMYELIPYIPGDNSNWRVANSYIYENQGNWGLTGELVVEGDEAYIEPVYETKWKDLNATYDKDTKQMSYTNNRMMTKGGTYSMLLPYCVGCDESLDERDYWDYWSGKFLIFESTDGPHTINGGEFVGTIVTEEVVENNQIEYSFDYNNLSLVEGQDNSTNVFAPGVTNDQAALTGNSTFAEMKTLESKVFAYRQELNSETFTPNTATDEDYPLVINPTTAFLLANPNITVNEKSTQVLSISSQGKIKYRPIDDDDNGGGDDLGTGDNHVPTINGGSDIFVTSIAEGINIAVSEPQYVRVFAANGALLFNGWVENSVDVPLVNNGVYVVVGENVSVKVIY